MKRCDKAYCKPTIVVVEVVAECGLATSKRGELEDIYGVKEEGEW